MACISRTPGAASACGNTAKNAAPSNAPIAKLTIAGSARVRCTFGNSRNNDAASTLSTPPSNVNRMIQLKRDM